MKVIYVLRHTEKDAAGKLTDEGKIAAAEVGKRLGRFDFVYSSDKPRAIQTAILLTGTEPVIDARAGGIHLTPDELRSTHEQGKLHPFGIAGVLFDSDMYRSKIIVKGKELVEFIQEILGKLSDDGRALIISHDGAMVAADMILLHMKLLKAEKTYRPLQGFRVFGNLSVEDLK
jgi:broad specificity phosphatase PhoE